MAASFPGFVSDVHAGIALDAWLARTASEGARPILCAVARWAPPAAAVRNTLSRPEAGPLLAGYRVGFVDLDERGRDLDDLGLDVRSVPVLRAWDPAEGFLAPELTGDAWGADSPENITAAVRAWLAKIPPLAAPPVPRGRAAWAILAVLVGLALLIGGAVLRVRADDQAAQQERSERIKREVGDSVRKALEESRRRAPPP